MKNSIFKKTILCLCFLCITAMTFSQTVKLNAKTPKINSIYSSFVNVPENAHFGTATISQIDVATKRKEIYREGWWAWDKDYQEIDDIMFVVYKFSKPVNIRTKKYSPEYNFVTANSSFSYSVTLSQGTNYTYETSASTELSNKASINSELSLDGINYTGIGIGGKVSTNLEVQNKVSTSVTKTTTYTYTESVTKTHTLVANESTYYSYEQRGSFNLYIIQVYQVQYNVRRERGSSTYQNYYSYYDIIGYKLLEQNVKYTLIHDSLSSGFYKYLKTTDGTFIYFDIKTAGIVYY